MNMTFAMMIVRLLAEGVRDIKYLAGLASKANRNERPTQADILKSRKEIDKAKAAWHAAKKPTTTKKVADNG